MKTWRNIVIGLTLLMGIGIFRVPILGAVTGFYNSTVRIVDSTGNIIDGVASAITAPFNSTVRVVDSTGHVIDSFGGGTAGTYPSGTSPQLAGFSAANVPEAETVSGDCAFTRAGANSYTIACTKSAGNLFTSAAFGTALNMTIPPAIGGTTPAAGAFTTLSATTPMTAPSGGTGTTYGAPACVNGGNIASAGTVTPDFTNTNCFRFNLSSASVSVTFANPTNLPTNAIVYIAWTQGTAAVGSMTWGSSYLAYIVSSNSIAAMSGDSGFYALAFYPNSTTKTAWSAWWSDGTNLTLIPPSGGNLEVRAIKTQTTSTLAQLIIGTDNAATTMARMPMAFSINQQTALVANEHMGTFKTVKAITIENIVLDAQNVTCAVSATVTCYDCGTSAGACTAGQTSTIATSAAIATGAAASVDMTVTTAAVAAAHYITCEVTAGTCATLQANVSMMARPQ